MEGDRRPDISRETGRRLRRAGLRYRYSSADWADGYSCSGSVITGHIAALCAPRNVVNTIVSGDDIEGRQAHNGDLLAAEDYPANGNVRETAEAAQRAVRSRLTDAESAALIQYSTGERPVIQDGYPVLGFADESRTVYVASIHPAVTCAATIGRLELCDGQSDEIPQCYRPSRFKNK